MNHGGKRPGAGRKSKAEEQELIERLSPMNDDAIEALHRNIKDDQSWAIKMYFEYMYGKPKETKDLNVSGLPTITIEDV
jgi:hypothetical protein